MMARFRRISSIVCVVLLAILIPISVLGVWAKGQLLNEQRFVATFAPLMSDPEVQLAVTNEVSRIIIEQVDVDAVAAQAFAGLGELGLPDRATAALGLLQGPAAEGMRSLIVGATERFVTSNAFATTWESALQVSHRTLLRVATENHFARGVITTSETGEVAIQLGPIVDAVALELDARGFGFAANVGPVDASFVVAQSDVLPMLAVVYGTAEAVGVWAPIAAVLLAALAVAVSLRRKTTLLHVLMTSFAVSVVLLIICAIVVAVVPGSVTAQPEGAAAIGAVVAQVLGGIRVMSWWIIAFSVAGTLATVVLWRTPHSELQGAHTPESGTQDGSPVTPSQ